MCRSLVTSLCRDAILSAASSGALAEGQTRAPAPSRPPPPPLSVLPPSRPTQAAPEQSPFTPPDMGLFVTNPRALPERGSAEADNMRALFSNPPRARPDSRPPRVKSNLKLRQEEARRRAEEARRRQQEEQLFQEVEQETRAPATTTEPVQAVLRIVPDGRSPRVKSNLLNKSSNRKHHQKNAKHKFKGSGRRKFGRSLDLSSDNDNEVEDETSEETDVDFEDDVGDNIEDDEDDYTEPEVRPDGRKPRIKSNILAKKFANRKNQGGDKRANKKHKKGKSGFRHSKKVSKPDTSFKSSDETTPFPALNNPSDGSDNAITTFRPTISLDTLINTNETFPNPNLVPPPPPVPAPAPELSVPLPNFDEDSIISSSRGPGFEPSFSDMSPSHAADTGSRAARPSQLPAVSVTEIVRVSSADQSLFSSDYSYYDYYEEFLNSI